MRRVRCLSRTRANTLPAGGVVGGLSYFSVHGTKRNKAPPFVPLRVLIGRLRRLCMRAGRVSVFGGRAGVRAPVLFAGRKGRVAFPGCGVRFLTRRNEKPALRANFLTRRGRPVTRCCAQGRAEAREKACGAQRAAPPGCCLPQPATGKACVAGIPTLPDGRKIGFFLSYPLGLHYLCPHERKTNCTESWRKDIGVARNVGHVFARLHRSSRA